MSLPEAEAPALDLDDIQSPVLRIRPAPYVGCHVLLHFADAAQGREFLGRLLPHVVSAAGFAAAEAWVAVALTYAGLQALGVPDASLASFPVAFREGMAARAAAFEEAEDSLPAHWEAPYGTGQIHAALTLLCLTEAKWQDMLAMARQQLQDLPAVQVLARDDFEQVPGGRTPFGYKDGISFPQIRGNVQSPIVSPEPPIAAGEFVLGYPGEGGRTVPVPTPDALGRNGTFLGFRKLHSRVAAFRQFLQANAGPRLAPELLAAKMIGRWPSGAPLMLAPEADQPELGSDLERMNNFLYMDGGDANALRCPLGAHIRRMNPRDTALPVMTDVRLHRIIRHGTAYGPPLPAGVLEDDGQARGIFFIFISATAPDTYEFLKKEWINDGNFLGLGPERDPVCGTHRGTGQFTIPMKPLRRKVPMLDSFTQTLGGEYAFMPSLTALKWLSELSSL
ncbi:MAG: peroxidase [Vicinamibacterales bacterium]